MLVVPHENEVPEPGFGEEGPHTLHRRLLLDVVCNGTEGRSAHAHSTTKTRRWGCPHHHERPAVVACKPWRGTKRTQQTITHTTQQTITHTTQQTITHTAQHSTAHTLVRTNPEGRPGMSDVSPLSVCLSIWNLRAVIWFPRSSVSSFVFLPSPLALPVLSFFC